MAGSVGREEASSPDRHLEADPPPGAFHQLTPFIGRIVADLFNKVTVGLHRAEPRNPELETTPESEPELAVTPESEPERLNQRLVRLRQDERRRIAEELHDSTAQHLVAAGLGLTNLKSMIWAPEARAVLCEAMQSIREATLEIRTFSYLLHPPQLGRVGLCAVLHDYLPGFENRTGIRSSLRLSAEIDGLPIAYQHAILRIAQESLCNVHRHARAAHVWISVRCLGRSVHLVVHDDGKGIGTDAAKALSDRLRLSADFPAMVARVICLEKPKGTAIHVAIPLPGGSARTLH